MIRSRLMRGLVAASPMLAFMAWYLVARPMGDTLVYIVFGVAAVATIALHRLLPWPKE